MRADVAGLRKPHQKIHKCDLIMVSHACWPLRRLCLARKTAKVLQTPTDCPGIDHETTPRPIVPRVFGAPEMGLRIGLGEHSERCFVMRIDAAPGCRRVRPAGFSYSLVRRLTVSVSSKAFEVCPERRLE